MMKTLKKYISKTDSRSRIIVFILIITICVYFWQHSNSQKFLSNSSEIMKLEKRLFTLKKNKNKQKCIPRDEIFKHKKINAKELPDYFKERNNDLHKRCQTLYGASMGPEIDYENFVAEPKTGLLYCMVYKVATTNWLKMLMLLSETRSKSIALHSNLFNRYGKSMITPKTKNHTKNLRSKHIFDYFGTAKALKNGQQLADRISMLDAHYKNNLYAGNGYWSENDCFTNISASFLTFAFVRHPFERLVSAYLDKFTLAAGEMNRFYQLHLGTFIISHFRPNASLASRVLGHDVTFPEFVSYILYERRLTLQGDKLWRPFVELCSPCRAHFDILGHFETFTFDKNYILHTVARQSRLNFGRVRAQFPTLRHDTLERKSRASGRVVKKYMKQLRKIQVRSLIQLYAQDFAVSGYKYAQYLKL